MANLSKREFAALDISSKSYLSWVLDAEIHLDAMGLADTIKDKNQASNQDRAKAMIFLCHHLDEILKANISLIISQLKLYGENITYHDMLEKTFFTFPASSMLLQQQYREMRFKKYSELNSHLLVAEQHNELLMKNHENRPTSTVSFPEVNEANFHHSRHGKGRGPSRGHGHGRGRNFNHDSRLTPNNTLHHQQCKKKDEKHEVVKKKNSENRRYRCGGKRHWSRTCRTPKHLVELYQASLKKAEKNAEANFISEDNVEPMHLDVTNFFELPEGKVDHLIGDGSLIS
ncbi:uncharacterized protein LOC132054109 [Lycium ferocissimum]|uniref:uncharacterized protein LOC132054109 n=1 Tax=Lycium ferocissimum TaxID=112874 RepID=UPI002815E278|nr:uncharacterized protein LOC132054109 [Lycium ferocissimum]